MKMKTTGFEETHPLDWESSDDSLLYSPSSRRTRPRTLKVLLPAFFFSVCINILVGVNYSLRREHHVQIERLQEVTRFAGLTWNTPKTFQHGGLYDGHNETLTNEAWASLNYDRGAIALTDEYAQSMGLPIGQRFPWDESKGLYFLNGHHSLHCLVILHTVMHELRDGQPLSYAFAHAMHCLDTLLQDIKCFADDTPRYASELHPGQSGFEQTRQCRDWNALEVWSEKHTSCWKDILPTSGDVDTLIRYKFCPPGSPYYDQIHQIFGDFEDDEASPLEK